MDFDMEKFSYRLIVLMEDFNMSQVDLSKKIGISNVTISRYLSGDRIPRLDVITKISSAFNVSVDYLLGLSDNRNGENANTNTDVDIALLAVCGSIQTRSYDAQDGTKRYVTEVIADEVEFLAKPRSQWEDDLLLLDDADDVFFEEQETET